MSNDTHPENIHETLATLSIRIDQIKPRAGNPRRGDVEAIAESLERNGQYRPVVVNRRTAEVLAGNHTYAAAKRLGWKHIAVTFVDVDEDQAARIILADNRTADLGGYDDTLLLDLLKSLDGDLVGTGYTQDDADALAALGSAGVADLDDLANEVGGFSDADAWPTIRFDVPPHVEQAWREHVKGHDTEYEALASLLGVDPE